MTPEQTADLLAAHEAMCWWVARRVGHGLSPEDIEDLAAEVRLLFVRSAGTFDPAAGTAFGTYALPFAVRHARRVARRLRAAGVRVPLNYAVEHVPQMVRAAAPVGTGDELVHLLPAPVRADPTEGTDFWAALGRDCGLTDRERAILTLLYRDGLRPAELVARGGWGRRGNVYRLVAGAFRKLRASTSLARLMGERQPTPLPPP